MTNFNFDLNKRMFSKQVENTVVKGEIAGYEHFLLFSHCFQKPFSLGSVWCTGLFGKVLESRSSLRFAKFLFLFCSNSVERCLIVWMYSCSVLTHSQMTNFRLFQTERLCRRQFWIWQNWQKVLQKGRRHCGKMRNCMSQAISPFWKICNPDS